MTYPINEPLLLGLYYLQETKKRPGECFHALALTNYYGDKTLTRRITYMLHDGIYIQRTPQGERWWMRTIKSLPDEEILTGIMRERGLIS